MGFSGLDIPCLQGAIQCNALTTGRAGGGGAVCEAGVRPGNSWLGHRRGRKAIPLAGADEMRAWATRTLVQVRGVQSAVRHLDGASGDRRRGCDPAVTAHSTNGGFLGGIG